MKTMTIYLMIILAIISACSEDELPTITETDILYMMPEESEPHSYLY